MWIWNNDIMFDSFVLFCCQWGFFASMKSWPSQENGTKIDLVFAVGRFCPEASAYEDFRSQSLRKWNQHRKIRRNPSASVSMQKLHFSLSIFSVHFFNFSVLRQGQCQETELAAPVYFIDSAAEDECGCRPVMLCCHQSVSHVRRVSSCPRILQNRKTYKKFWKNYELSWDVCSSDFWSDFGDSELPGSYWWSPEKQRNHQIRWTAQRPNSKQKSKHKKTGRNQRALQVNPPSFNVSMVPL